MNAPVRLTKENIDDIKGSRVCLLSYDEGYVRQMIDEFGDGFADRIDTFVDYSGKGIERSVAGRVIKRLEPGEEVCLPEDTAFVITDDYHNEIFERFRYEITTVSEHSERFVHPVYFYANRETSYDLSYRAKYENTPLRDMILFRSGPHAAAYVKGTDFSDNARAVFEYMLASGLNEKYELVWLVKNPDDHKAVADRHKNVRFLSFDWSTSDDESERDAYYEALCLSKYIFFTDAYGFCRNVRGDQTRVQLWHGCGFKTRVNFVRCERRYEYMPVISPLYADIHRRIYGLRGNQVLVTGYPKEDAVFHPRDDWRKMLGIRKAGRYIFWLPTFRKTEVAKLAEIDMYSLSGETGLPVVDTMEELHQLDELLRRSDIILVLKLHPFQDSSLIHIDSCTNITFIENHMLADHDIQINELLGHADALISDYSSVAVDYLLLDRPIAFTIDDIEEYEKGRGFVFEPIRDWLPGAEVRSFGDFLKFVEEIAEGIDSTAEKRRAISDKMHSFHDDQSCRRLIEALGID